MRDGNAIDAGQGAPGSDSGAGDGGGSVGEPLDAGRDGAAGAANDVRADDRPEPAIASYSHHPEPAMPGPSDRPELLTNTVRQFPELSRNSMKGGELEIPELVRQIPEPDSGISVRGDANDRPELVTPGTNDHPELLDLGDEIDGGLDKGARLWNFETYGDKYGKRRLRRVLRFVTPPVRDELGVITSELSGILAGRPGRGRWAASRIESATLRSAAESAAQQFKRNKRRGARRANVPTTGRDGYTNRRGGAVSRPQPDSFGDEVSPLLM